MHPIRAIIAEWNALRESPRGERFRARFDAHERRSFTTRVLLATLGLVFIVVGVVMLVAPGPGLVFIAVGLSLGSLVFRPAAALLDAIERAAWRVWYRIPPHLRASRAVKVVVVLSMIIGASLAALTTLWVAHRVL